MKFCILPQTHPPEPVSRWGRKHWFRVASEHIERGILGSSIHSLRLHTQSLHAGLENTAIARDLLSPSLTLTRYREILAAWANAWTILETTLQHSEFSRAAPELLPAARVAHAIDDLRYFGHAPESTPLSFGYATALTPSSLSGFVGICYVVRGASLGGKVIAKHLEATLGLGRNNGAGFFGGDDRDALTWVQWMRNADTLLLSLGDIDEAKRAAATTFSLLTDLFSRDGSQAPSLPAAVSTDRLAAAGLRI